MVRSVSEEIGVDEARGRVLAVVAPLAVERVPLDAANGAVLAEPIVAPVDLPLFTNSAMDGYATRASDLANAGLVSLPIVGSIAAGDAGGDELAPGAAIRIMTGAPLPVGADVVVPFEQTDDSDGRNACFNSKPSAGTNVRFAGSDARAGDRLLAAGDRIGPLQIALLASLGLDAVAVHRRPHVAVLATGSEIAPEGSPATAGRIWNANTPMLLASIADLGAIPIDLGIARDDPSEIAARLDDARTSGSDLLITSGGVSAGDFDLLTNVLDREGEVSFWSVKMRPGRPLAFGNIGGLRVLGLPGNPVAAAVSFQQFARPAILTMLGLAPQHVLAPEIPVTMRDAIENRGGRRTFVRVVVTRTEHGFDATLAGGRGSANVVSLARSNGLLVIPESVEHVRPGDRLQAQITGWLPA